MTASKFIILGDQLVMSSAVEYHRELVPEGSREQVHGGGRFHVDHSKKTIMFYGTSDQYKTANPTRIRKALENYIWDNDVLGYEILWSASEYMSDALKNHITIGKISF